MSIVAPEVSRGHLLTTAGESQGSIAALVRLTGYLRPHLRLVVACYATWLGATSLDAIIPLTVRQAIDGGIVGRDSRVLLLAVGAMLVLFLAKAAFNYAFFSLYHYYETAAGRDIRGAMYGTLQRLSFSFFDRVETGQLISRSTSDVEAAQMFLGHGLSAIAMTLGTYVIMLAFAFTLSWQLTLLSLITLPILVAVAVYFGKEVQPMFARAQQQHGVVTGIIQENLAGVRVVKAFAREAHESAKFERAARLLLDRNVDITKLVSIRMPLMAAIVGLGTIFVIWYGGKLAIEGTISIGTLIAFNYYLARLMGPARRIGWVVNIIARAFASAARIFEVMDSAPDVTEKPDARPLADGPGTIVRGEIRFEHVSFEFEPGRPVLRDVDLSIRAGEVVGIVGETGSGKSALAGLVPRFYDATAGRVTIDGVDVRDLTLDSLRRAIAIVQQDPFLFSRSLRENIAFGQPAAVEDQVRTAATRAQAHRFAQHLPAGYETIVGDRGLSLSGGQRQRATLARAILVEPSILILDDAVSSVDVETEHRIEEALKASRDGRTTLIIAHRTSTVRNADRIIVFEKGRVVEIGSHDELVALGGRYARIHAIQSAG